MKLAGTLISLGIWVVSYIYKKGSSSPAHLSVTVFLHTNLFPFRICRGSSPPKAACLWSWSISCKPASFSGNFLQSCFSASILSLYNPAFLIVNAAHHHIGKENQNHRYQYTEWLQLQPSKCHSTGIFHIVGMYSRMSTWGKGMSIFIKFKMLQLGKLYSYILKMQLHNKVCTRCS